MDNRYSIIVGDEEIVLHPLNRDSKDYPGIQLYECPFDYLIFS